MVFNPGDIFMIKGEHEGLALPLGPLGFQQLQHRL
jgi:hypothetical protein